MPAARKLWSLSPQDSEGANHLAAQMRLSPVVAQLLVNRKVTTAADAKLFLDCPMAGLLPPHLLPGVEGGATAILEAVRAGKRLCVYGDYDVDGTTGTAVLMRLFTILKAKAEFYVPNRVEEGYGVNMAAVRQLAASGVDLLITVDCGITAVEEVAEAKRLGMTVVVTDHHEMKAKLPAADHLVHPGLPGSEYPPGTLSGSGVAFKLAWMVAQRASNNAKVAPPFREFLLDSLALAALGLVADVMPLRGENRVFVKHGLDRLNAKPVLGLQALVNQCGMREGTKLKAEDIAFKLAPRLNAAGRLECARLVVDLLTTTNPVHAQTTAEYLEKLNKDRQTRERKVAQQARDMVEELGYADDPGLVVASREWHPGVVGIVASRLVDHFGKPSLVIAQPETGPGSGSGRTVAGLALHQALDACTKHLVSHGGHSAAAGFKVHPAEVENLRAAFNDYVRANFDGNPPAPRLKLEVEVPLSALTFSLLNDLDKLEPYGTENTRPKFLASGLKLEGTPRRMGGDQRHLSFRVRQGTTLMRAVAFGMGDRFDELMSAGGECCVAFTPKLNEFNGQRSVELDVIDFRPGSDPALS
jgi:single-stranded-DNA-specific exonuclease